MVAAIMMCATCGSDPCINPHFCQACRIADRQARSRRARFAPPWAQLNDPRNRPTPKATVDAVLFAVKTRGLAALQEPGTKARVASCDARARAEINQQIEKLGLQS